MDPVHESGPWTRSKVGVHGPLVHVLSSPDVSRRGTSATQRQKFDTDDVKSIWNPVRSADWSTE